MLAWAEAVPPAACFLSRITLAELRFGIARVADPASGRNWRPGFRDGVRAWFGERILEVDENVLLVWRRLAWDGRKANYTYAQPDALIAATALVHDLGVVTRNTADFVRAGVTSLDPWGDPGDADPSHDSAAACVIPPKRRRPGECGRGWRSAPRRRSADGR